MIELNVKNTKRTNKFNEFNDTKQHNEVKVKVNLN